MVEPTVISTFAGCGGSSLGYHWAGFKELLAIDFDTNSVETFRLNFPDVPCWQRDIKTVTADEILEFCKIGKGELDVFDGSPPCQGFSTAGKRKLTDPRNDLFLDYVRLIEGLQPKVFLMENVSGMIKGGYKGKYNEILKTLKATGYNVKVKLMNAMWYEVPQSRERLIFIGVRNDLGIEPSYPEPLGKYVTVGEAIENIKNEPADLKVNLESRTAKIMKGLKPGECDPKHHSHRKIDYNKPCPTLLKDFLGYYHFWHPEIFRPLNLKEWKRLASFPDDYKFTDKKEGCQRIGNAVMPKFMYHIAKHIKENILI